jgi:hypothetical protein
MSFGFFTVGRNKRLFQSSAMLSLLAVSPSEVVKPFACGELGRSALRACPVMASPFLPDQFFRAERRYR